MSESKCSPYLKLYISNLSILTRFRSSSNVPDSNELNVGDSDFEEDKQNTSEISEDEQIQFTETHEENNPLQQTGLSEENLSRSTTDNRKEKPDGEQRIIEKRPVEKELVKRNGSKRQKITEKILDIMQRNSAERSERQAKVLNAIETRNVEEDSIDTFFKSMAMSVKQLSHYSQIRAKMEICRIVGELELRELQQPSTNIMPVSAQPASSFPACSVYSTEDSASTYNSRYSRMFEHVTTRFSTINLFLHTFGHYPRSIP